MSIIVKKRGDKKYLYFAVGGSKRLYLGTIDNPKEENIYGAIGHIRSRIREYEQRISELENYLPVRKEELSCSIQYNLVFFDLDGVLYEKPWYEISSDEVAVSTWDVIFQELGIYNVHEKLKHNYETGVFKSYMEWTEAACEVLKSVGLDKKTFETVINRRPLMQGAAELCEELHEEVLHLELPVCHEVGQQRTRDRCQDAQCPHCYFARSQRPRYGAQGLQQDGHQHNYQRLPPCQVKH